MSIVSTLLIIEYRYFKDQSEKLSQVKEDYQTYIQELKDKLDELNALPEESGQKKKSDEVLNVFPEGAYVLSANTCANDDTFSRINRDEQYLKESAIAYAQEEKLGAAVAAMYDSSYVPIRRTRRTKAPLKRKRNLAPVRASMNHKLRNKPKFPIVWPLEKSQYWLSSFFGPRKQRDGKWGFHYGLDMAAIKGTPVHSVAPGTVVEVSYAPRGYGKTIVVRHDGTYRTRYAHLDQILVKVGQPVKVGQLIGRVGDTGSVRGRNASHLHLEVMVFGKRINPLYILS